MVGVGVDPFGATESTLKGGGDGVGVDGGEGSGEGVSEGTAGGEALGAVAVGVGVADGGAAIGVGQTVWWGARVVGAVGISDLSFGETVVGHQDMVGLEVVDEGRGDVGEGADILGVVVKGRQDGAGGGVWDAGQDFVEGFDGGAGGGRCLLGIENGGGDVGDALFEKGMDGGFGGGIAVAHADCDGNLGEMVVEAGAEGLGMDEKRRPGFGPDALVGVGTFGGTRAQDDAVHQKPAE